ncbi:phage minor structural protein, N-terminal region [Paenibacillus sp. UNCCL117]|uniref:phage tail spike protein n=1 Tax=unclassified Paenibacillus TaxID=185978 RepID=UPI000890859A|nr:MULTISPECIES: phage tail spike protein [unclassified Paenibacillus]SDD26707.1 phage minor structural protein, N-terminal region [Paenibacillus sp. cl123]SFW40683.1 phage minor structural protein, N-terminal region [Paenibacillus sp. UNCCL117]
MPNAPITIYDNQMRRVAYLQNAFGISYETPFNGLWTASFSLPANDPKSVECKPLYFVEVYDERERVELFRILPQTARRSADGQTVTYSCEHVLATLLDDVLFQYHTVGNLGYPTANVLQYILSNQTVKRWQLGSVGISRQFEYNWENETLLAALISVPRPFTEQYQWTYDTTVYPWRINLVEPPQLVEAYIRYGVNMQGVEKTVDPTNLCNRIYGLGYGEGVNQLTFAEINAGRPYIEDAASQAQYGVISRVMADRRFEYPETLLARCEALLSELKQPRITYTVAASEIGRFSDTPIYKFYSGALVRVQDKEMGIDFTARVVNKRKRDVRGQPGAVELEIANRPQDIAGTIADLANRQRIGEVYAQGATNLDSHDFADNCDPTHPAVLRFRIDEQAVRVNKVLLSYKSEAFRGYNRPIQAAPAVSSGPSSKTTTASGGGQTSGSSSATTTAAGGATTSGPSSTTTTNPSGANNLETPTEGDFWPFTYNYGPGDVMSFTGLHDHGISAGVQLMTVGGGYVTWVPSGNHRHGLVHHYHKYATLDHTHGMDHTHTIGSHVHNMEHTHQIASHTHDMDHTHEIPAHNHEMEYGIFEGPIPSAIMVKVDGVVIPGLGTNADDIDIIPYLSKDGGGKINRGWHNVEVIPNSLGRIVASINTQVFCQSRGGGDF